jgi:hypothetical protein
MPSRQRKTDKTATPPSEALVKSRARQGLPPTITDPAILAAVQALIELAENEPR